MNGNEKLYVVLGGNGNATVTTKELADYIVSAIESGGTLTISSDEISDATTLGKQLITAKDAATALGDLGAGAEGIKLLQSADAATALTDLGGGTAGIAVFKSADGVAARTAVNAASAGTNSDIHSLTGLTTPLTIAQGGTGNNTGLAASATKLATARNISLSFASSAAAASFDGSKDVTINVLQGVAVADSVDATDIVASFNKLLASLRTAGLIATSS